MSRQNKQKRLRFKDIWVNQTELGKYFGIGAVAIGKKLREVGLRSEDKEPTEKAKTEGYCTFTPMQDGTPFYLWNKEKVAEAFRSIGMSHLNETEAQAYETAKILLNALKEDDAGNSISVEMMLDDIREQDYSTINRFLQQLGSSFRLGDIVDRQGKNQDILGEVPLGGQMP